MEGLSERAYANQSGLSRGAVQKARKNGRLVLFADGSINAAASDAQARTALTVYQAQERQLSIQKKKGVLVDRARAETLVFRLARQERDVWVTWPTRVAALMAAQLAAEMEAATGSPVTLETAILQRVLETHVREQLDASCGRGGGGCGPMPI